MKQIKHVSMVVFHVFNVNRKKINGTGGSTQSVQRQKSVATRYFALKTYARLAQSKRSIQNRQMLLLLFMILKRAVETGVDVRKAFSSQ
jgi:hypothetical protein